MCTHKPIFTFVCVCVVCVVCVCVSVVCVCYVCVCVGQERKARLEEEVGTWEKKHHATSEELAKLSAAAAGISIIRSKPMRSKPFNQGFKV